MNNDEIEKTETLTPQQETFCVLYTTIGEETFSHGTKSAELAGYAPASCRTAAWKLLRTPKVRERIAEIHTGNMSRNLISIDSQLAKLEHLRRKAEDKQDLATAVRCVELIGKYLCIFSKKLFFSLTEPPQSGIDPEKAAVINEALNDYYTKKYLAPNPDIVHPDSALHNVSTGLTDKKTIEQELQESDLSTPQTPTGQSATPLPLTRDGFFEK
jgi:hypothetical protein